MEQINNPTGNWKTSVKLDKLWKFVQKKLAKMPILFPEFEFNNSSPFQVQHYPIMHILFVWLKRWSNWKSIKCFCTSCCGSIILFHKIFSYLKYLAMAFFEQ